MLRKSGKLTAILMAGLMIVSPLTEVAAYADEFEIITDETILTEDDLATDDPKTGDPVEMDLATEDASTAFDSLDAEEAADDELLNPGSDEDADAVSRAGQDDLEADTAVLPTKGRVLRLASAGTGIEKGQHLYFGKYDSNYYTYKDPFEEYYPYWRVLDNKKANDGISRTDVYMFVMSESAWDTHGDGNDAHVKFGDNNTWQNSDAQRWCEYFYSKSFDSKEQVVIKGVDKNDLKRDDNKEEAKGLSGWEESTLKKDKDRVFFLSAREVYDYVSNENWPGENELRANKWLGIGNPAWLRSPLKGSTQRVGVIGGSGQILDNNSCGSTQMKTARPAFNIDFSQILFTSDADVGKDSGSVGANALRAVREDKVSDWKLTVRDDTDATRKKFKAWRTDTGNVKPGGSIKINYENAKTGSKEFVSAVLCDSTDNVLYYGQLVNNREKGETSVTIPTGLADGTYKLMVFSEQYNGPKKTDYASKMSEISIVVETTKAKLPQTITASNFTKKVGDKAFNINAKTNGGGKLTYSSSNTKVVKVDASGKVTIVGVGKAKITINAAATEKYDTAQKIIEIVVKKDITKAKISGIKKRYYNGKARGQKPVVKIGSKTLVRNKDYTIKYTTKDRINAGKVKYQIIGKGDYSGTINKWFRIYRAKNTLGVSVKKVSVKASEIASKKKTLKAKDVFKVKKAIGKVTYTKLSGEKKITVARNGKVTVKKGLGTGKYKVKVKVKAKGDKNHKSKSKTVTFTVTVK